MIKDENKKPSNMFCWCKMVEDAEKRLHLTLKRWSHTSLAIGCLLRTQNMTGQGEICRARGACTHINSCTVLILHFFDVIFDGIESICCTFSTVEGTGFNFNGWQFQIVWTRKESFQTQQRRAGHPLCSLKYRQEARNRSSWSLTCLSSAKTYSRAPIHTCSLSDLSQAARAIRCVVSNIVRRPWIDQAKAYSRATIHTCLVSDMTTYHVTHLFSFRPLQGRVYVKNYRMGLKQNQKESAARTARRVENQQQKLRDLTSFAIADPLSTPFGTAPCCEPLFRTSWLGPTWSFAVLLFWLFWSDRKLAFLQIKRNWHICHEKQDAPQMLTLRTGSLTSHHDRLCFDRWDSRPLPLAFRLVPRSLSGMCWHSEANTSHFPSVHRIKGRHDPN